MKIAALLILITIALSPVLAFAIDINNPVAPDLSKDPTGTVSSTTGVFKAISNITNWIFSLFLVLAVIFILYGAYTLLISGGDAEGFAAAKKLILYSAIAVVMAVLSKSIIVVAAKIVGVKITL